MKNITLVTLKKVGEVNPSLEHQWRHNHNDAPVTNAKWGLFVGYLYMTIVLVCVGIELWQKYHVFPVKQQFALLAIAFIFSLFSIRVNLLGNTKFGTKLEEICKIFDCNLGQLAVMTPVVMDDMAEDILDNMIYDLVCKERKYKPNHPITAVARAEYERVLAVFVDLGISDGKVDDIFARAKEKFALEHDKQKVIASA